MPTLPFIGYFFVVLMFLASAVAYITPAQTDKPQRQIVLASWLG